MTRNRLIIAALFVVAAGLSLMIARACRDLPHTPAPPTSTPVRITPTVTASAENPATATRTPIVPSATPQMATNTPTAEIPATVEPTATPEPYVEPPPFATVTIPLGPIKGIHTVVQGDTLWGIACVWYADLPLLPGANPLTPCTCWPGIYWRGPQIHSPQLILPGERYQVPEVCGD